LLLASPEIDSRASADMDELLAKSNEDLGNEGVPISRKEFQSDLNGDPVSHLGIGSTTEEADEKMPEASWSD
jgi:hypothetical protein